MAISIAATTTSIDWKSSAMMGKGVGLLLDNNSLDVEM